MVGVGTSTITASCQFMQKSVTPMPTSVMMLTSIFCSPSTQKLCSTEVSFVTLDISVPTDFLS